MLTVKQRIETITYKQQDFEINHHYYEAAGQQFTTDETDEVNLQQVYEQYEESI